MVLVVQKPVYTKTTTPTGATDACHTFGLESDITLMGIGIPGQSPAEVLTFALTKEGAVLQTLLTEFLRMTVQHFAKPYSVANVLKSLKHDTVPSTAIGSLRFQPQEIQISSKGFLLRWKCEEESLITLPDMETDGIGGDDIDAVPLAPTNEVIQLQSPNIRHIYDRQKVKEANLRAKLAQYKANRAHLEYLEKYGAEPSESSDSETDESDDSQ